jgi:hypothetical protein
MKINTESVEMGRRTFLRQTALVSTTALAAHSFDAATASAVQPIDAAPGEGIRLGFDTYSIRGLGWKDMQYLDYAASLHLDNVQLSSLNDYESLDPAHLQRVRELLQQQRIDLKRSLDFAKVKLGVGLRWKDA